MTNVDYYPNPIPIMYLSFDNRVIRAKALGKILKPIPDTDKHQIYYLVDSDESEPHLINARQVLPE